MSGNAGPQGQRSGRFLGSLKDALVAAIDGLVDHGYLLPLTVGQQRGRGRPASPTYRIHPSENP